MMNDQFTQALLASLFGLLVRCIIAVYPYSGYDKPPMHGDFEAQRHWMEITFNLPITDWYSNGTKNDLQYWGLDYPPLTAYHSWACGWIANQLNSSWITLFDSRGVETLQHKMFMRYTVLVVDLLIYFPAVYAFFQHTPKKSISIVSAYLVVLMYPGLILIDHGHFQYNCVSLGFALWAVYFIATGHDLIGSAFFVFALNYKQMELYHAMPFFCYLLGSCFRGKENWFSKLVKIGFVVIGAFAICWFPFLSDKDDALQVLHRLFPFARGLFEDKVANFWCSLSVVIKIKQLFDTDTILKICLLSTVVGLFPSSIHLLLKPSIQRFKYALVNCSLVFFLFSFQVHEKSILIPALSVCLLIQEDFFACCWFLIISTFSMLPLLIKDGLLPAFIGLSVTFILLTSLVYPESQENIASQKLSKSKGKGKDGCIKSDGVFYQMLQIEYLLSLAGAALLTVGSVTVRPPPALPDLLPLLVSVYSCGHFILFLLYFHYKQFTCDDEQTAESTKNMKTFTFSKKKAGARTSGKIPSKID